MEQFKIIYVRYDDSEAIAQNLKNIMDSYDMSLDEVNGDRYVFEKDRSYYRTFKICESSGGWTKVYDDDTEMMDSLCQELSGSIDCPALCCGVNDDIFFYTLYNSGEQTDQYLSGFDCYEYELTDEVRDFYGGNADAFRGILDDEGVKNLQDVLNKCTSQKIGSEEAMKSFQLLLNIAREEDFADDEEIPGEDEEYEQDESEEINPEDIFYVDFENINVKTGDREKIISAIENYAYRAGYRRVEEFTENRGKKGLFKRMFDSVSEYSRLKFYISPGGGDWVTFVGEKETLHGDTPDSWDFLDIGKEIALLSGCEAIKLFADSQRWGFEAIKNGGIVYEFSSDMELDEEPDMAQIMDGIDADAMRDILSMDVSDARDIDRAFGQFASALKIRNSRVNIPMDYSEEEFKKNVLDLLPDGKDFIELKFEENK